MASLEGRIGDAASGPQIAARIYVMAAGGEFRAPDSALHNVGHGDPFFYSEGRFGVDASREQTESSSSAERNYRPCRLAVWPSTCRPTGPSR